MNTKALAKHYDTLGPWERVPLICAASALGDELERERLARSAPTVTFRMPNYYGLSNGLRSLGGPGARFRSISEEVEDMREYLASHLAEWS